VEILSVSSVGVNLTGLAIASKLIYGKVRIQLRVRILRGSWPILSNALNVENPLRKTRVVII